jgi:hypothetical protein
MSKFKIDFFELAFLAEACIPPRPIARAMFWHHLTDVYWEQMTEGEREHLFEWMNKTDGYKRSLENQEDTQVFHARFDPDNQYLVHSNFMGNDNVNRTFKFNDLYYVRRDVWVSPDCITKIEKI